MKETSNYRRFLLLWSGELVSAIGGGLTSFGLGVYVFNQTHSAGSMALVTLLAFLPTLLLSAPAGVLADRYDRRLLMMLGDGLSALGLFYILICMTAGEAKLWQICVGVSVSSVFSSLLEPSYRATITDLLTPGEYSKASGMVSLAGSARYLVSPLLAALLLDVSGIRLILLIDIATFFLTVACTAVVRRGLEAKKSVPEESFKESFRVGWQAITGNRGVFVLILVSAVITCFMGAIQILSEPMILSFADSRTLGVAETVCAMGMLVSSLLLGIRGISGHYVRTLCLSLAGAGAAMVGFGAWENIVVICAFGFLFFFLLPFANNCLDYLARTSIDAVKQGRAWGLISFLSQSGYVVAYGAAGWLADRFTEVWHTTVGRGAALVTMGAGVLLIATASFLWTIRSVRSLEAHGTTADME
ncbi:MAG: MFS transporter [Atopobiaceae bacterium]|nr:MFS transporter [Atopobiaceae bacterium]